MGTAQDVLNVYRAWLAQGIRENPPGSNRTPIGAEFGWDGVAWCAEAASVALKRSGIQGLWSASCYELIAVLKRQNRWHGVSQPQVGSLAFYSTPTHPLGGAHVNIVESVSGPKMVCLGGNESDSVRRSVRSVSTAYGFGLPAYRASVPVPKPVPVPAPQPKPGGFLMALSDKQQDDLYNAVMKRIDPRVNNLEQWGDAQQDPQKTRDARLYNIEWWLRDDKGESVLVQAIRKVVQDELKKNP